MSRRDRGVTEMLGSVGRYVEELASGDTDRPNQTPKSHGRQGVRSTTLFRPQGSGAQRIQVPRDHEVDYWEVFEQIPFVRESIRAFASEVLAPGYYVEAPTEDGRQQLEKWLEISAISAGQKYRDWHEIAKKSIIQREVRGFCLIEKVPDGEDGDGLAGFMLIPPQDIEVQTYPNKPVLLDPEAEFEGSEDAVKTEGGEFAAYIQVNDQGEDVLFTADEVIKLTRDEDVGEIFGVSRIEAVKDRILSLEDKVNNNDLAIKSMAWKFWLIQFGSEDDPWSESDIEEFMTNHTREDFTAGMKQGVTGDVDIETISGEVADISDALDFDVNWIMSAMPGTKYALGAFEGDINQFVSRSQETRFENQVREARRELEGEFNPALREKALELGVVSEDNKSEVNLRIATPPEEREMIEDENKTDFTRPASSAEKEGRENANAREPSEASGPDETDSGSEEAGRSEIDAEIEELARYEESDTVDTPDGKGVVAAVMRKTFKWPVGDDGEDEKVNGSSENPAIIVALVSGGSKVYRKGDLTSASLDAEKGDSEEEAQKLAENVELGSIYSMMEDPFDPVEFEELVNMPKVDDPEVGFASMPNGWNRKSVLQAWATVGGTFTSCRNRMVKHMGPRFATRWCAALKDEVLGTERWRNRF